MKQRTIRQHLQTALFLLVMLLLAGVGLALWIESERSGADERREQLLARQEGIYYDVLLTCDALRGLALTPKDEW